MPPNELKDWNVPRSWSRYFYIGTIGVLMTIIGFQRAEIIRKDTYYGERNQKEDEFKKELIDKYVNNSLQESTKRYIDPKLDTVRAQFDSLKKQL